MLIPFLSFEVIALTKWDHFTLRPLDTSAFHHRQNFQTQGPVLWATFVLPVEPVC